MKGGKREGAGRPKSPATAIVRVRLTPEQQKVYAELGGSRWTKRLLDEALNTTSAAARADAFLTALPEKIAAINAGEIGVKAGKR